MPATIEHKKRVLAHLERQMPDWLSYDPVSEILTIDGIRFHRDLFRHVSASPCGISSRIIERKDGVVTITRDEDRLAVAAPDILAALKAMLDCYGDHKDDLCSKARDEARAAITKATERHDV